ncbi:MAG: metalloprotease, partial [Microcystis sp. M53600_WE12]|nr:metalloprotease [Microcystis sp. M53600_WE12]
MKPNSGLKRLLSLISAVSCSSLLILSPLAQRAQADDITDALEAVIEYTAQLHQINFKYLLSDGPITTPCGVISLAAFCTVDNTVYVNLKQVTGISDNPLFPLYAVAHEA